jgi:hypothetical protein
LQPVPNGEHSSGPPAIGLASTRRADSHTPANQNYYGERCIKRYAWAIVSDPPGVEKRRGACAERHLSSRAGLDAPGRGLAGLAAGDVTAALPRESESVSVSATQTLLSGLRSFLRFCFVEGLVGADLSQAALVVRLM